MVTNKPRRLDSPLTVKKDSLPSQLFLLALSHPLLVTKNTESKKSQKDLKIFAQSVEQNLPFLSDRIAYTWVKWSLNASMFILCDRRWVLQCNVFWSCGKPLAEERGPEMIKYPEKSCYVDKLSLSLAAHGARSVIKKLSFRLQLTLSNSSPSPLGFPIQSRNMDTGCHGNKTTAVTQTWSKEVKRNYFSVLTWCTARTALLSGSLDRDNRAAQKTR